MMIELPAADLGVSTQFVESLARAASHHYKTYSIPKRTGGFREIHHPSKRLKAVQRWLLANVIEALPVHAAAAAYRRGRSILDNAEVHVKSRYLLRMDLESFFPSISQLDISNYISSHPHLFLGWTSLDVELFGRLVCRNSALTIGAPTSPALSNALCYDLDVNITSLCARSDVMYTRYADDLFFSARRPNVLREIERDVQTVIADIGIPANLKINKAKTRHSSKRGTRRVTGIVLGSDGKPHVGRTYKRRIRTLIHTLDTLDTPSRASLSGMIAHATGLDPQFMNSLISKFGLVLVRRAMIGPSRG
jgi:RNA-directed DNA polymerase